ncbi:MAG: hypothetical protein HY297_03230 [Thaumarchaeota archaeon]|nr:hypothetical protein [Nitrososphaerota archaeon]
MAAIPSDYTIVGTVLAIAIAIILLSGLALYISFRVKETFREERGRGARVAKVGLLVGLLFLSGGVFFFFSSGFSQPGPTNDSSSGSTSTISGVTTTTTVTQSGSVVGMSVSYPSRVSAGSSVSISFTLVNNGASTPTGASIDVGSLFYPFSVSAATKCNPQCTPTTWSGSVVQVGDLTPGVTVVTLSLTAPSQPQQYSDTVTLYYVGTTQQITANISIQVISGHP